MTTTRTVPGWSARRRMRRGVAVLAGALVLTAVAACSSTSDSPGNGGSDGASATGALDPNAGGGEAWAKVVADAEREGTVVVYSSADGADKTLPREFNKIYPKIKVQVVLYASGDLTSKLDAEAANHSAGADVAMHSTSAWWSDNTSRLTKPIGPAYERYWAGTKYAPNGGAYVVNGALPLGAAVNTDALDNLGVSISTWKDLLNPKLKGQIGFVSGQGTPAAEQWWYYAAQEMGGDSSIAELAALKPRRYATGTIALATDVASGEIPVGFYTTPAAVKNLAAEGAPIKFVPLTPPICIGGYVGIVGSAHPNAAQVFMNWVLSPAGQAVSAGYAGTLSAMSQSDLGAAASTVQTIPAGTHVTDGVLTPEQTDFYNHVFSPALN